MKRIRIITLLLLTAVLGGCGSTSGPSEVPVVILDTDIGSSTDDLFAMELLYRYEQQGRCRVLGIVADREGTACAACADAMNTFFGHGEVPVGLERNGIKNPAVWVDYQTFPSLQAEGKPLFRLSVPDYSALPDGWQLYRQLLSSQPDGSVTIVSIGFLTCLSQLLESGPDHFSPLSGVELVRQKVKRLYMMGGVFVPSDVSDYNILQGLPFAKTFFRLWPAEVEITFSPGEVGEPLNYSPEAVLADLSEVAVHPIKQVYETYPCDAGQRMWDPLCVINAVEGDAVFTLSPYGVVTLSDEGKTVFTETPDGRARYQMPGDDTWNTAMLRRIADFTH